MRQIIQVQKPTEGENTYPFCVAGINITCIFAGILRLGDASFESNPRPYWKLFEEPSAYYELYTIALVIMDQTWFELQASYMSFPGMKAAMRRN